MYEILNLNFFKLTVYSILWASVVKLYLMNVLIEVSSDTDEEFCNSAWISQASFFKTTCVCQLRLANEG